MKVKVIEEGLHDSVAHPFASFGMQLMNTPSPLCGGFALVAAILIDIERGLCELCSLYKTTNIRHLEALRK